MSFKKTVFEAKVTKITAAFLNAFQDAFIAAEQAIEKRVKTVNGVAPDENGNVNVEGGSGGIAVETDPTVPAWAKQPNKPTYTATEVGALPSTYTPPDQTAEQVGADPKGTAANAVSEHNAADSAHGDIRLLITGLTNRLNALANSTDTDLDQMAELVAYIKNNKSLIDGITTSKVSVADIINNLTTNVANKPLSAAQGVALKALIDAITIPTKVSQLANDKGYLTEHQDISGKLDASALPTAINTALAQAKESGEFDGEDGQRGTGLLAVTTAPSSYTTAVGDITPKYRMALSTIKTQAGVTEVLLGDTVRYSYYHYPIAYLDASYAYFTTRVSIRGAAGTTPVKGVDYFDGLPGDPGDPGYTPVRGVDYWTTADKTEIETFIATELAKRNQVQLEFAESIEWLEANGDKTKLYVLNDKADPNYGLFYAWTLTQKEVESGGYTNLLPTATTTDRKTIYGGDYNGDGVADGYKEQTRLSSSSGSETTNSSYNMCSSGFISAKEGDILRIKGYSDGSQSCYVIAYNSSNSKTGYIEIYDVTTATVEANGYTYDEATGIHYVPLTSAKFGTGFNAIRICYGPMAGDIVTINEEIKEGGTTIVKEYAWASTGHALVPADYEDRIVAVEKKATNNTARIVALEKGMESGGADETDAKALERIKVWDKPVYDPAPVTLIADNRAKPVLTTNDRTISAIYAKYRALMAAHPDYITETNMGKSAASSTFTAVDMLRFDFCESPGLTQPDMNDSARHETKPTLIFLSGIHTEWAGVWALYYALEEITTNPDFDDVRRNARIVVIPCANPFCLTSQTAIDGWRMSHVNANGVAIHNNFGVNHSTSGAVGEYNYGGPAPYSEPETQYIDAVMAEYPDAVAFVSCHNNDYSTYYGSHVIWASSATYHMCNVAFRLVDKLTKAWLDKYGDTLKTAIDQYKINMDANDYRLGRATMSTSKGTEQLNATKYGIQGVNLEIARMMKVFSGSTDGTSEVMTHGAEVYANFMRTLLWNYDHKDKKEYAPNLPWSE